MGTRSAVRGVMAVFVALAAGVLSPPALAASLDAGRSRVAGTVDRKFVSFGVDISALTDRTSGAPFDFTRPRLSRLVRALGPAYIRFSGTKIDQTYYDPTGVLGPNPPGAYKFVLGAREWDAANRFAAANGLRVIVGVNAGPGPRNADSTWNPDNARALLGRAATIGLPTAVVSFGNEPNLTVYGASNPVGYSAEDYLRDVKAFLSLRAQAAPRSTFIGPGSFFTTGAERPILNIAFGPDTSAIMPLTGRLYDAVSYHHYPAFGNTATCAGIQPRPPTDPLAAEYLDRVRGSLAYMRTLRDANAPRRPLWVDEFGNTACGGVIGYSNTLAASFYYLNALGTMARGGVHVATRWTISGSQPYALIDNATLTPRPDYWAALLWKRLMGTTVLEPAASNTPGSLRVFSSCTPGVRGGVTTLALNTDPAAPATLRLDGPGARGAGVHAVTGDLTGEQVALNGGPLELTTAGELPALSPAPVRRGTVTVAPAAYAFITEPRAGAPACGAWRWPRHWPFRAPGARP